MEQITDETMRNHWPMDPREDPDLPRKYTQQLRELKRTEVALGERFLELKEVHQKCAKLQERLAANDREIAELEETLEEKDEEIANLQAEVNRLEGDEADLNEILKTVRRVTGW